MPKVWVVIWPEVRYDEYDSEPLSVEGVFYSEKEANKVIAEYSKKHLYLRIYEAELK